MLAVAVVWMRTVEWDVDWGVYFGVWLMSCGQWGESVFRCQEGGEGSSCVLCCNLDNGGTSEVKKRRNSHQARTSRRQERSFARFGWMVALVMLFHSAH